MPSAIDLSLAEILLRLTAVLLLVLANAFFVAAEFSLVGARRTHIEALARTGNRRAKIAHAAVIHLNDYLSATQLGITIASLALGWIGEETLATMLRQVFERLPHALAGVATHAVAGAIAFMAITFLHIVLGELAPKSIAVIAPERTSLWTAAPLSVFYRIFRPIIWLLNGAATLVLRPFGVRAPSELERVHRPEEIQMLVTQSYEHGLLSEEPVEMIRGVFDLSETTALEVMTPRTDIVAVPATASVDEVAEVVLKERHSRVPVFDANIDEILGVVLASDVWEAQRAGTRELRPLVREVPFIPDTKSVEDLLRDMKEERVHLAVVLDEFGGTAGIVTMEDLLEEIVGEICDEHERRSPGIQEQPDGELLLAGSVSIRELNERYRLDLPEDEFTTVAGYILGRLSRIPEPGDEVAFNGGRMRVVQMSGRRVTRVLLALVPQQPSGREGA